MIVAPLLILTAFLESSFEPDPPALQLQLKGSPGKSLCATARQPAATAASANSEGIADLPFAMGRRFATLDAYLTHLECLAQPVDLPWWKEIEPGIYKHMTTATNAPPNEVATRAELMRRFGFSR
jgi:hypothetical protein